MPSVESVIERRLLVNYRIDPERVAPLLPPGLRPQLQRGFAVGGVCLLRLGELRLRGTPRHLGLRTENAAHRFAVEWDDESGSHAGVYVPRRDTSSRLASQAGGRLFPGRYHRASFTVEESPGRVALVVESDDGDVRLAVQASAVDELGGELFSSLAEALEFFRRGSLGWSPGSRPGVLEAVRLESSRFEGSAMRVEATSSVFDDDERFPAGSCTLDSAIVMRSLPARWTSERASRPGGALRAA